MCSTARCCISPWTLNRAHGLRLRIEPGLPPHGQVVDRLQKGERTGFNNIRAHRMAALNATIVLHLNARFPLGIFPYADTPHLVVAEMHLDTGNAFDAREQGI